MIHGVINVYKEKGFTSHDVVAKLRGILRTKKIGHTGTLDPEAEGVLPVCIGKATKLASMITDDVKTYETTLRFGQLRDTGDHTGQVLESFDFEYNASDIEEVLPKFTGDIMQVPPMYSALKVNGKKLYELAREGKVVERKPRPITIYKLELLEHLPPDAIRLRVTCSKGTYIRTLCEDIGKELGYGGYMDGLVRTSTGQYELHNAVTLSAIEDKVKNGQLGDILIDLEDILKGYKAVKSNSDKDRLLLNGNPVNISDLQKPSEPVSLNEMVRMYTSEGQFIGLYTLVKKDREYFKPFKILQI